MLDKNALAIAGFVALLVAWVMQTRQKNNAWLQSQQANNVHSVLMLFGVVALAAQFFQPNDALFAAITIAAALLAYANIHYYKMPYVQAPARKTEKKKGHKQTYEHVHKPR